MKKTILGLVSVVVILLIIISAVLAVDVGLNLQLRRKASNMFSDFEVISSEPAVVYLGKNNADFESNASLLLAEKDSTGDTFISIDLLKTDDITTNYDSDNQIFSLVGYDQMIVISSDGTVYENGVRSDLKVTIKEISDGIYLNLSAFNRLNASDIIGFEEYPYVKGGHLIIYNKYERMPTLDVASRWLFDSQESLDKYLKEQFELEFLYSIKNIFKKTQVVEAISDSSAIAYQIDDDTLLMITDQAKIGYALYRETDEIAYKGKAEKPMPLRISRTYDEPIVLTWEAVYSFNPNTENIGPMDTLNVISPTWYELSDSDGNITSMASQDYVSWAKSRNYEVWALVSNAFDIDRTHAFLYNADARERFIQYMLEEAAKYGYEGINIDFENVYMADKDALTHFVNEFAYHTRKNNITLSMDVTVMGGSDNWSKCYDHEKLGAIVDFLVIMTYDEHWASSPISGPVASYDWMLYHMKQLAEVVSPEKLVMGVPLYTRVWREFPSTEKANTITTRSSAIGMEAQNNLIAKYNLTPIWDDVDKLYYATFFEEGNQVKIWIENAETIEAKIEIIDLLGLKGVAAWRRGFETPDIWSVFEKLK